MLGIWKFINDRKNYYIWLFKSTEAKRNFPLGFFQSHIFFKYLFVSNIKHKFMYLWKSVNLKLRIYGSWSVKELFVLLYVISCHIKKEVVTIFQVFHVFTKMKYCGFFLFLFHKWLESEFSHGKVEFTQTKNTRIDSGVLNVCDDKLNVRCVC